MEKIKESARETLKPNFSGYSAKRRWRSVLLPTPDGPESRSGRRKSLVITKVCDLRDLSTDFGPNHHHTMGAVCCKSQPIDFEGEANLFHFMLLRCVGKGAFGKVWSRLEALLPFAHICQVRVVQHKQTKELYALKYINKAKCVKMKAVPNIIQERRLLEEVCRLSALGLPSHNSPD